MLQSFLQCHGVRQMCQATHMEERERAKILAVMHVECGDFFSKVDLDASKACWEMALLPAHTHTLTLSRTRAVESRLWPS